MALNVNVSAGSTSTQTQVTVTLTSAQLLALNITPQTVIPAPGAGFAIVVDGVIYSYTFVTTPYDTSSQGALYYGTSTAHLAGSDDGGIALLSVSELLIAPTTNQSGNVAAVGVARSVAENAPVTYGAQFPFVNGDGTMKITAIYHLLAL